MTLAYDWSSPFESTVPSYYISAIHALHASGHNFEGALVLEIGGSSLPRELVIDTLGARQWTCVDIIGHASGAYQQSEFAAHYDAIGVEPLRRDSVLSDASYLIFDGAADRLPASFEQTFDIVFSINAFEHILDLDEVLAQIYRALRPNGILFSQFGPLWSCSVGSHFWVREDFCFNKPEPMPPFAHLRYDRNELASILERAGISSEEQEATLFQVFESDFVNRRFFEEYEDCIANSGLIDIVLDPLWSTKVKDSDQAWLQDTYPGRLEFSAFGLRIVAKRPADS
jgi:SAM-dependent methyltransferase